MITLIQAVRLLGLNDYDLVWFCDMPHSFADVCMSVAKMRKRLDMRAIRVYRIGTSHFWCSEDESIEFIVSPKDVKHIAEMERRDW